MGKSRKALNDCLRKELKGKKFGSREKAKDAFVKAAKKCSGKGGD